MLAEASCPLWAQPPCGSAENISVSSKCGCRLSTERFDRFALAANGRWGPHAPELFDAFKDLQTKLESTGLVLWADFICRPNATALILNLLLQNAY